MALIHYYGTHNKVKSFSGMFFGFVFWMLCLLGIELACAGVFSISECSICEVGCVEGLSGFGDNRAQA